MRARYIAAITVFLCSVNLQAQDAPRGPVDIRSERLVVHQKKHQAVFSGNVKAVQGDLLIRCAELTVTYASGDDEKSGSGDIEKMVFTGNVSIEQEKRRGHCERAEYDRTEDRIVCTGDPWVIEDENRIDGERIEYLLELNQVRIKRPRAVIRLDKKQGKTGGSKK